MKKRSRYLLIIISLLFVFSFFIQSVLAYDPITVDFYYSSNCGDCVKKLEKVEDVRDYFEQNYEIYNKNLFFEVKDYIYNATYKDEYNGYKANYTVGISFLVVQSSTNLTIISDSNINFEFINNTIQSYIEGLTPEQSDLNITELDLFGYKIRINAAEYSLPVLTIILGVADSFNPCAFFILLFLMNLLIHVNSRRKMLLIGGIFVFFSGLIYFIFMVILNTIFAPLREHLLLFGICVGVLALAIGILNIKDFFFFKKGASLSIPESKKPGIYKRMRNLVKASYLPSVLIGTIILAISVNIYELICSAILPTIFISQLTFRGIVDNAALGYIFFYNVVYVIPLIIIVLIFIFTLSRRQLTEWHGQILKLFSGIMIASFGIILMIDYMVLENLAAPILILLFSTVSTLAISKIWKKYAKSKDDTKKEEKE